MKLINMLIIAFVLLLQPSLAAANTEKTPATKKEDKQHKEEKTRQNKSELDWGDWQHKFKPQQRYGVGIKGKLQNAINTLDKSNLINDSNGVQVSPTNKQHKPKKVLDIKKMKAELKALEKKDEQEIDDDIDY